MKLMKFIWIATRWASDECDAIPSLPAANIKFGFIKKTYHTIFQILVSFFSAQSLCVSLEFFISLVELLN